MLNSDISDTETQPQPDIDRASLSSAASSEFSIDIKAEAENQEKFDKLCVSVKTGHTPSPVHEGLLKIASPLPPSASVLSNKSPPPSPRSPSPGPPLLEPMTSIPGKVTPPSTSSTPMVTASRSSVVPTLPTAPLPPLVTSVTRPLQTPVTSAGAGQQTSFAPAAAAPGVVTPAGGQGPIQQIILPPVQAGQQHQFILQPQQLAAAAGQPGLTGQLAPPQAPIVQSVATPHAPIVQSVATPQSAIVHQTASGPVIQLVQAGLPLQYGQGQVIPMLNPQGQLMATMGGVTNQAQLMTNLQNFVMMVQPTLQQQLMGNMGSSATFNQQPVTVNQGNPPIIIKQEPMASHQATTLKPGNQPINIAPATTTILQQQPAQPTFISSNSVTSGAIKLGQSLPSSPLISSQPNFNVVQTPSGQSFNIIQQPQVSGSPATPQPAVIQQSTTIQPALLPSSSILQPQSNAMNILANNTSQVTTASINLLPSTPQPQQSNVLSLPQTTAANSSPTVQLVQDPNTGLYNLVQQQPQQQQLVTTAVNNNPLTPKVVVGTPQPLGNIVADSPKRSATPLSGSPMKVPKLLLPSSSSSLPVPGTKENKPEAAGKQFMCGVCNKYFGNQKNLRVHISEIHEGKRGQFPCDICHKVFPRKRNMERHKNALHLKNSPFCNLCHKSVVNLEMHVKRFHKSSTEIKTETQIKVEASSA